jgi:DNA-binding MarR family transcriptional regulator
VEGRAREQALVLTPAGKALVPQLARMADANDAHFFGHLSEAKRVQLMALMQGIVKQHGLKTLPTA